MADPVIRMALAYLGARMTPVLAAPVGIRVPRRLLVLTTGPGMAVVVCVMCLAATLVRG